MRWCARTPLVFRNPQAKVTIVEFFDPSCETCRAFYPLVKSIVNASFGQVRLVVRYAPLHPPRPCGEDPRSGARGQYWPALEKALADQPRASHGNPQPELIWESIADTGFLTWQGGADAESPAIAAALQQDIADMKTLGVKATPGFFVNGRPLTDFGAATAGAGRRGTGQGPQALRTKDRGAFAKIGELAHGHRHGGGDDPLYEREGLVPSPPARIPTIGSTARHVQRLAFIRRCRSLDMSLDEVRVLLRFLTGPRPTAARVNAVLDDEHIGACRPARARAEGARKQLRDCARTAVPDARQPAAF